MIVCAAEVQVQVAKGRRGEGPAKRRCRSIAATGVGGQERKGQRKKKLQRQHDEPISAGKREKKTYGDNKRVTHARDRVCDLVPELDVVVVEPAAGNDGEAVEPSHARLREEAREHVADHTANAVRGEDLHKESNRVSAPSPGRIQSMQP